MIHDNDTRSRATLSVPFVLLVRLPIDTHIFHIGEHLAVPVRTRELPELFRQADDPVVELPHDLLLLSLPPKRRHRVLMLQPTDKVRVRTVNNKYTT